MNSSPSRTTNGESYGVVLIARPRLANRLDRILDYRLTSVIASAGFGKTTALRQWTAENSGRARSTTWHTLTAGDRALPTLARSIVSALRLMVPSLSGDLFLAVEGDQGPDTDPDERTRANALAALVCEQLQARLTHDLVLILDDIQLLEANLAAATLIGGLSRHASPLFHIVVASRDPLPFAVGRLRVEGNLAEFTTADLAFTVAETRSMLETMGSTAATEPEILTSRTAGWPAAIRLAAQARLSAGANAIDDSTAAEPLYDYLAEEILASEDPTTERILSVLACLPWANDELVERLEPGAATRTDELLRQRIFLTGGPQGTDSIMVAPLMAEFLRQHVPLDDVHRQAITAIAADFYVEQGAYLDALACLFEVNDLEAVARLLDGHANQMVTAGFAQDLVAAVERLPPKVRTEQSVLAEAQARQILGDWEGSLRCYELVVPGHGSIAASAAWRMGLLHHMRGDVAAALAIYERGLIDGSHPADEATLLAWTASARWLRGDREECRALATRALASARSVNDAGALAASHTVLAMVAALDGDRAANDVHYLRALEHAEQAHDVLQTIRIRSNRGSRNLEEGDYPTALEELDIALRLADSTGFAIFRGLAASNRSEVLYELGRLDEAAAGLEEARAIFRRAGSRLEAYPLRHLGDVYATRGDTALARASFEAAIELCEDANDLQGLVPALAGLARTIVDEDPQAAAELISRALSNNSVLGHASALLAAGWVALARNDPARGAMMADEAATLCRSRRDQAGLAEALELQAATSSIRRPELLDQARRMWIALGSPVGAARIDISIAIETHDPRDVRRARRALVTLVDIGARGLARSARRSLDAIEVGRQRDLVIRTLGGFELIRDGTVVDVGEWQSRVARDLLKMLVAARGRPVNREVLIERLWPDETMVKSSNRFSVALSTIRGVFDPDKSHDGAHYLLADRESVALNNENIDIDVERFLGHVSEGRALLEANDPVGAVAEYGAAEELYAGDFLEEQPFVQWAASLREECRVCYLQIAADLAQACVTAGDFDGACRYFLRMLERDRFHEPAHLGLVGATGSAGRHGDARRLYGAYVAAMNELVLEPASFPGWAHPQ